MNPWHPALYDHWYAVARTSRIGRAPVAISLLDRHIALARTEAGNWLALEDRCPHRHAPLSAGCVQGDHLVCTYHGWSFGADGGLKRVPGLPPFGTGEPRAFQTEGDVIDDASPWQQARILEDQRQWLALP